jgi:hypothetical protein
VRVCRWSVVGGRCGVQEAVNGVWRVGEMVGWLIVLIARSIVLNLPCSPSFDRAIHVQEA